MRASNIGSLCLRQRFSTGGKRTPRGTPAVAKGYAGKNSVTKYFLLKQIDNTSTFLLLHVAMPLLSYSVFHKITQILSCH